MANTTVKTSREIRQHEGRKYMTTKGIAEMSGIAYGALTSRLYRMKQERYQKASGIPNQQPAEVRKIQTTVW